MAAGMAKFSPAVLVMSSANQTQAGQERLGSGEMLLYSGNEE